MSSRFNAWHVHAAGIAIAVGLSGAGYWLQIGPALARHEQAAAHAADLAAEQSRSRELERTLLGAKEKLIFTEREVAGAEVKLEPPSQLNSRLARLTELAAANGLRVDSVESGQTVHSPRYSTIAVRLTGQGGYRSCAALLKQMHREMRDVAVVALEMGSGGVNSDTTVTFAFDLLWYTRPGEPARKN
jgi:Tfp pilus assembly protein PilO